MLLSVVFILSVLVCVSSRLECHFLFVGLGVGAWGAVSKKFGCKSVDDNGDGLSV